jgi:hypothetical protein
MMKLTRTETREFNLSELLNLEMTMITDLERDDMRTEAIFVCEDEQYFVLKTSDHSYPFVTVCGAQHTGLSTSNPQFESVGGFDVNLLLISKFRDEAIARAFFYATNDAGREDSTQARVQSMSAVIKDF